MPKDEKAKLNIEQAEADYEKESEPNEGAGLFANLPESIRKMPLKEKPPMDVIDILRNLQQINNNMNQIAVNANAIGFVDTASYWDNVLWLRETVSKLMEVIYT